MVEESVLEEINRLSKIYKSKEKEYWEASNNLEKYVNHYLNENGTAQDMESLGEVIDVLPGGVVRFKLLERFYLLKDEAEKQQERSQKQNGQQLV